MTELINVLEIIGVIAFSVSGAILASGKGLDIFGVVFVGCITAFGGGMLRDILLGICPPAIFSDYTLFIIAFVSAVIVFIAAYVHKEKFELFKSKIDFVNNFFDAVGLAAFSVSGAEVGFAMGYSDNIFIIVAVGMLTGIGGGIMRDIIIDTTPYVFKKHIYALASLFGSLSYYFLRVFQSNVFLSSAVAMFSVVAIRMLATRYCWSLPKVTITQSKDDNTI